MIARRPRLALGAAFLGLVIVAVLAAPDLSSALAASRDLTAWVARHRAVSAGLFLVFATLGKITPVPGGVAVMLTAGFLFGPVAGPALAALGSALAAVTVTAAGRFVFPDTVARLKGSRFARYEEAAARDGVLYLMAIRILPLVPAWIGNLLPVAVEIRLRWVFLATLIGVAPLSAIVGSIGSRLQDLSEAAHADVGVLFAPDTLLPLIVLVVLALLPVALRPLWSRRR